VVVTPATIVLLGDRLDSLDVRRLARRLLRRPEPVPRPIEQEFWYRSTKVVMRRAAPIGLVVIALLVLLGTPFLGVRWGLPDDRVLPRSASAHQVGDQLRNDFANNSATAVTVVVPDANGVRPTDMERYAAELSRVPDVTAVSGPTGTFVAGARVGPPSAATGEAQGSAFLTVSSTAPVEMAGSAQINRDSVDSITSRLPLVLGLIAVIMFGLLFLLTGSVVLPVKALVLSVFSLTAAFGAMVWIFQDGHLGALGTTSTGTLVANIPVLLFCIAFGLSMDYEVFLVSRIREFWLASGRTRADNDESIALGRAGDVDLLRGADRRACVVHADVRPGPDTGRVGRRHAGAHGLGAGIHSSAGHVELVGAQASGLAARTLRTQRRSARPEIGADARAGPTSEPTTPSVSDTG
jgi:RND superfamily putative drug exporter